MASQIEYSRAVTQVPGGRGRGPRGRLAGLQRVGRCPVPDCHSPIDSSRLMCRRHWYLVPKQIRDRVWATWQSGQGAFSREHQETVRMAITASQVTV